MKMEKERERGGEWRGRGRVHSVPMKMEREREGEGSKVYSIPIKLTIINCLPLATAASIFAIVYTILLVNLIRIETSIPPAMPEKWTMFSVASEFASAKQIQTGKTLFAPYTPEKWTMFAAANALIVAIWILVRLRRDNYVGRIPERLCAEGTCREPEFVLRSREKVDFMFLFFEYSESYDAIGAHLPSRIKNHSTTDQKSFGVLSNSEFDRFISADEEFKDGVEYEEIKDWNEKAVRVYTREGMAWRSIDMECPAATFETVAMESEVKKGVIDDLDKFVVSKEEAARHKKVGGKTWKRVYLLYDPPGGTGSELSLIAAMANYLSYDIYDFNLTSFSSSWEMRTLLASTTNRSIIAIKDFDCIVDMQDGLSNPYKFLSKFFSFFDCLGSRSGNERIIVFTTNHKERLDPALLHPFNKDFYVDTSSPSPQPRGLPEGGENLQLDPTDQQSLVDFDAINNRANLVRADRSVPIVCNSEKKSTGEALKREFIDSRVVRLEDMQQYSGGRPDDAPKSLGDTVGQGLHQPDSLEWMSFKVLETLPLLGQPNDIIPLKNIFGQGLHMPDSLERMSFKVLETLPLQEESNDITPLKNTFGQGLHTPDSLERMSFKVLKTLPLQEQPNDIIPLKNTFGQGLHTLDSLEWTSFKVLETLPLQEQPNDIIPLKKTFGNRQGLRLLDSPERMSFKVLETLPLQEQANDIIPLKNTFGQGLHMLDFLERMLFKVLETLPLQEQPNDIIPLKNTFGQGLHTPNSLERMSLKVLETLPLQEHLNDIIPLKREFVNKGVRSLEDRQQHLGRGCEDDAKILVVSISNMKGILRRHEIHKRPFQQNRAIMKERPKGVLSLSMDEKLDARLESTYISKLASSSPLPLALPCGGEIVGPISLSSSEVAATNIRTHLISQDQGAYTASHFEKKITRVTSKRERITSGVFNLEDGHQHFCSRHKGSAKCLGVSIPTIEHIYRKHGINRWPYPIKNKVRQSLVDFDATNNGARLVKAEQSSPTVSNSEKENTRGPLKREHIYESVLSLEDLQHFGGRSKDAAEGLGEIHDAGFRTANSLVPQSFKVRETLPLWDQPNGITDLVSQRKLKIEGCVRLEKLPDLPQNQQMNYSGELTPQSASFSHWTIGLPRGEHTVELDPLEQSTENAAYGAREDQSYTVYLSEKKIVRKTLKRKFRIMCVLSLQDCRQHTCGKCEDAANSLGLKHICREHGINQVPTVKRICRQNEIHWWLFQQSAITSHWPIGLPDGGLIVQLELLELSTYNVADGARAYQSCLTVSLSNKKILRKTLKREFRPMIVSLENHLQYFGSRCEDSAKILGVKPVCWGHGINQVSTVKRIRRQHRIHRHRWPFRRKWASMKGYSLGEERPVEIIGLPIHEKLVSRLQRIYRSRLARSSHRPLAIRNGGKIEGHIALSSSEFAGTNNRPHLVRQDRSGSNAPHPEKRKTRDTTNKEGTASSLFSKEDLEHLFGMTRKDAAEKLGVSESTLKRICREHGIPRWQNRRRNNVWRPPDPHGERNISSTCETLAIIGQIQMEDGIGGQNLEPNDFPFEDLNLLIAENGSIAEFVNIPTFHNSGPVYSPDMGRSFSSFCKEIEEDGVSFNLACQLKDPSTPCIASANPSAPVLQQPQIASTQMLSENMESSQQQPFLAGHVSGYYSQTVPTCSGPTLDQPMPSVPYVMPTIPQMTRLIEWQDMRSVTVKAMYGDTTIKFELPLTSGIIKLKEEVAMRLELDSFDVEYKDEEGDWIRIACDKDLWDYLLPFSLLANPTIKLLVLDKVGNGTNFCDSYGSLKRKRPY